MDHGTACLRFIKGSHTQPTIDHKKSLIRGFSSVIEDTSDLLPKEMLENEEIVTLEKGECVFFSFKNNTLYESTRKANKWASIFCNSFGRV